VLIDTPATASSPASDLDAGVIEEARARQRRHRRAGAAAFTGAAAIAGVIFAILGGGSHNGGLGPSHQRSRPPLSTTPRTLVACVPPKGTGTRLQGEPSRSLLSILAVLRRPAGPGDALPAKLENLFLSGPRMSIYVRYVRRARVINGASYYLFPARATRCVGQKSFDGLWEFAIHLPEGHGFYGGSGGGGQTAAQIEQGEDVGSGPPGSKSRTTVTIVVPDGVTKVTLRYPAGVIGGFNRHHAPAVTYTARPVGNLVVIKVMRKGNRLESPAPMTWYGANGRIVTTLNRL